MKKSLEDAFLTLKGRKFTWTNDECFEKFFTDIFLDEQSEYANDRRLPTQKSNTLTRVDSDVANSQLMVANDDIHNEFAGFQDKDDEDFVAGADDVVEEYPERCTQFIKITDFTAPDKLRKYLKKNADVAKKILNPSYEPTGSKGFKGPNYRMKGFASKYNKLASQFGEAKKKQDEV